MKKISVLFAAVLMFMSFGAAKAQKMATVDLSAIFNVMPEKIKADEQLKAFSTAKQAEIEKVQNAAEAKFKQYQAEASKQTAAVNEQRGQEMQKIQANIQAMYQAAQKDLAEKQDAAYAPIDKRVKDAIARAAKANGWDFVIDSNISGLYYSVGPDATIAVKKELGL